MGMFFHSSEAPAERPADPAVRRANVRRIGPLFKPYWRRLSGLLALIVVTAALGVVPAFLLRRVLNAIVHPGKAAISWTAGGMLLLSWELSLFAFALIPLFAVLTRRVGNERRKIAKSTQESLADISSLVQESLSVSGIMLGKTMGRSRELAARFESESLNLADLEVRQR